jgi:preprotein translocase subunit SecE
MTNKQVLVILGVVIVLAALYFGAGWLIAQIPGHIRPPH